jgi:hypothetical protein
MRAVLIVSLVATRALAQASDPVYVTDLRPRTQAGKMAPADLKHTVASVPDRLLRQVEGSR